MENTDTEKPFLNREAARGFQEAQERLFGINEFNLQPNTPLDNPEQVREAVERVLSAGLEYTRSQQREAERGGVTRIMEAHANSKDRPPSTLDFENEAATYQRAIDVVQGKRHNPRSLEECMAAIVNQRYELAVQNHRSRVGTIPRGLFGLGGPNKAMLAEEQRRYEAELNHIKAVYKFVKESAPSWANQTKNATT